MCACRVLELTRSWCVYVGYSLLPPPPLLPLHSLFTFVSAFQRWVMQLEVTEQNRNEITRLSSNLTALHEEVASLRKHAAEEAAKHEAESSALRSDLATAVESLATAQKEVAALQNRVAQCTTDLQMHQEARKAAEGKYQSQLQVRCVNAPWPVTMSPPSSFTAHFVLAR
jgi:hypothetical protein